MTVPGGDLFRFLFIQINILLSERKTDVCLKLVFLILFISLFSM